MNKENNKNNNQIYKINKIIQKLFPNKIIWHTIQYYSYDAKIINKSFKLYKL